MRMALVMFWAVGICLASVAPAGLPTFDRIWGGRGSGPGKFNGPYMTAVNSQGHVYVTDPFNGRVQKFTGDGVFLLQWGGFGNGEGEFSFPKVIAVDGSYDSLASNMSRTSGPIASRTARILAASSARGSAPTFIFMPEKPWSTKPMASSSKGCRA